ASATAPRGLESLRMSALEAARSLTLPSRRDADWRFTDLSALYQLAFRAPAAPAVPAPIALAACEVAEAAHRLVFVDGVFAPALSAPHYDESLMAMPLAAALRAHGDAILPRLASLVPPDQDAFSAINAAHLHDGAVVVARAGAARPAPLHLLFVSTQAQAAVHPRVLIVAEPGAELTVIEDYSSLHDDLYCVNAVTEIIVAAGAGVRHVKLQRESTAAFHIATCAVHLDRDARFASHSVALGARISRLNLNVVQSAPGASMHVDGLAMLEGRQLADTHSFFDHAAPDGASRQTHKAVLGGQSHGVFNGRILVRPHAQRTDSAQQSRTLLLSQRAHVDSKPQLEIFADDVKCSHGATVGQLDADELFYLRSRGLSATAARNLLTYGFAAEIVDRIPVPSLVSRLHQWVLARTEAGSRTE
ncbi:MAG TPA: Fe-S cluster assembly protein SufD, partial [Burkholderiaceae bacterium]|nr:Fe-S cluster assembly protein SufD [Burkholderiaceae bacterium]